MVITSPLSKYRSLILCSPLRGTSDVYIKFAIDYVPAEIVATAEYKLPLRCSRYLTEIGKERKCLGSKRPDSFLKQEGRG